MMCVIQRGESELQDQFFDIEVDNTLPKTLEPFKEAVVDWCTDTDIQSMRRYKNEKYSRYVERLRGFCKVVMYLRAR